MAENVDVRSVEALGDLSTAIKSFSGETSGQLAAISGEIQRTGEWLQERVTHWRRQEARCREEVAAAQAALRRCEASGDRDHPPDCRRSAEHLAHCVRRLREVEAEVANTLRWQARVSAAAQAYQLEAGRLHGWLNEDAPRAVAMIQQKLDILQGYTGLSPSRVSLGAAGLLRDPLAGAVGSAVSGLAKGAAIGLGLAGLGAAAAHAVHAPTASSPAPIIAPSTDGRGRDGVQPVDLSAINSDDFDVGFDDFPWHGRSYDDFVTLARRLETEVRPLVERGATLDDIDRLDTERGLVAPHGLHEVYQTFYSDPDAITLSRIGDGRYQVDNGRHRIFVARQLGYRSIPARVVGSAR